MADALNPSRRAALGALAGLPALAIAPAALLAASAGENALQALDAEMERLWAIEREISAREESSDADVNDAVEATSVVVDSILATPATSIADFKVKARALSWCCGGEEIALGHPKDASTSIQLVRSIIRDLLAA